MILLAEMSNDFLFQVDFVRRQARRLLSLQDRNPIASSFGCFHLAYWRDKTSEFPDTRFQEAGATLLLLSQEKFYDGDIGLPKSELVRAFSASLHAWEKQQHADGSFDEWYKHEHGFAATAFSLIAKSLAVHFAGDSLDNDSRSRFDRVARRAAEWLCSHEDLVKYNHQMAGAAALALAAYVLKEPRFIPYAKLKFDSVLRGQHQEGWFTEIAGMDLGYCFVLLDYAGLYRYFSKDHSGDAALQKLFQFSLRLVQPDLTISPEAGLCLNPYVSRLGTVLLSEFLPEAAELRTALESQTPGWDGLSPTMADDLRLCRWSHLPLAAELFRARISPTQPSKHLAFSESLDLLKLHEAGVVRWKRAGEFGIFLPCSGGGVRLYLRGQDRWEIFEDFGYEYTDGQKTFSHGGYDNLRPVTTADDGRTLGIEVALGPVNFVFPGLISRLGLRILGVIPGAPYWIRKAIDFYRKKNKTAINQSVAPVSSSQADFVLKREIRIHPSRRELQIFDELTVKSGRQIEPDQITSLVRSTAVGSGSAPRLVVTTVRGQKQSGDLRSFTFQKTVSMPV